MSKVNNFNCPSSTCKGARTKHIELSWREALDIRNSNNEIDGIGDAIMDSIVESFTSFCDYTYTSELIGSFRGVRAYKCCNCGNCTWRKNDGTITEYIGKSK